MKRILGLFLLLALAPALFAQGELTPSVWPVFTNANGVTPVALGFVCTTVTGGNVRLDTYQNAALSVANQNPIRLSSVGRAINGSSLVPIFLQAATYRFTLYAAGTANTCNGTPVGAQILQQDGIANLAQLYSLSFATRLDDKVCHPSQYGQATEGANIAACISVLPTTGGTIDGLGLEGSQSWASCPFTGVTKSIDVKLGKGTRAIAASCTIPRNIRIIAGEGTLLSPNNATVLTLAQPPDAGPYQIFTGAGSVVLSGGGSIYQEWWGALADGTTDSSSAIQKAVTAVASAGASAIWAMPGTYLANGVSLNGANGLRIIGQGEGEYTGVNYKTRYKYNGGGATGIFTIDSATNGATIESAQLDGNVRAGYCLELKNNASSGQTVIYTGGSHLGFNACLHGVSIGENVTGFSSNFNFINIKDCYFYDNTVDVQVATVNTEFMSFDTCQTQQARSFNFKAIAGAAINLKHFYFGTPNGATSAVSGPWILKGDDIVEELGAGVTLFDITCTASFNQASIVTGLYSPSTGDVNNYIIYWSGCTPLTISGTLTGQVRVDPRVLENRVVLNGVVLTPVVDSTITGSDPSGQRPLLAGPYTGADTNYYIKTTGAATFQWRSEAGVYSANVTIPTLGKYGLENGLIVEFPPGIVWTNGSEFKYPVVKTGVVDILGGHPEPFVGISVYQITPQPLADAVAATIIYDGVEYDALSQYNTTTGVFTALYRGYYDINTTLGVVNAAAASFQLIIDIWKNGALITGGECINVPGPLVFNVTVSCHRQALYLNQGDAVLIKGYQDSAGAMNTVNPDQVTTLQITRRADLASPSY